MAYDEYYEDFERPFGLWHLLMLFIAGAIALAVFDAVANIYAPSQGMNMPPLAEIASTGITNLAGADLAAQIMPYLHWLVGIVVYPLAYVLLARPIARVVFFGIPWWVLGAIFGAAIWAAVHYGFGHFVNGAPMPHTAFDTTLQTSLIAHVCYGVVLSALLRMARRA